MFIFIMEQWRMNGYFFYIFFSGLKCVGVRHVTGNDEDYLRKIPRVVVQKSALL